MPKLLGVPADEAAKTMHGFDYTSISVDKLGASEYTVVCIVTDKTSSVDSFKDGLEKMIGACVESCQKSPRALNLLLRVTAFSDRGGVEELHGFTLLSTVDPANYEGTIHPNGLTNLFEATLEGIESIDEYVQRLFDDERICNANCIIFIITDGDDNASPDGIDEETVKEAIAKVKRSEVMESIRTILIGVNDADPYYQQKLGDFKEQAGLDEYESMGDVTPAKLAKCAQFMSQSISSTEVSRGTGQVSAPVDYNF